MAEESRQTVELRLRAAVESAPSGLLMSDAGGRIVLVNREIERLFGYPREELLGQPVDMLVPARFRAPHPEYRTGFMRDPRMRAMGVGRDLFGLRKDGTEVPVEIGLTPVVTDGGMFVVSAIVDISARKQEDARRQALEDQLRQSQRMESLGRLAGGIAHDFNNILGAILGYAELAQAGAAGHPAVQADLEELLRAAARGKDLVDKILRFSRRQETIRKPIDLRQAVMEAAQLLRATLPAPIEMRLKLASDAPRILGDATSIHQVLMNLATNAAHAMPGGGVLEIALEPTYVRDSMGRLHPELHEGPYALLVVRDTGTGIDPETMPRVFEPFFTTKEPGQGSGLGLSQVHGIVRDHEGLVELQSEVGKGTTVRCLFPALPDIAAEAATLAAETRRGGGERVLYVDDESALANVGQRHLKALGYHVTIATDPVAALGMFQEQPEAFDVVITDYSMPQMVGLELAAGIHRVRPELPIVLLTGYIDGIAEHELHAAGVRTVLMKPVSGRDLAATVHRVLGRE